jgi:hypothetical protein
VDAASLADGGGRGLATPFTGAKAMQATPAMTMEEAATTKARRRPSMPAPATDPAHRDP